MTKPYIPGTEPDADTELPSGRFWGYAQLYFKDWMTGEDDPYLAIEEFALWLDKLEADEKAYDQAHEQAEAFHRKGR